MPRFSKEQKSIERRRRIRLSVAAHAYEKHGMSFLTDAEYDEMSQQVDLRIPTGNRRLDRFFREWFEPDTGMWVHRHPEREKLERLFQKYYKEICL